MKVDYTLIPALHAAARRHRSQVVGALIAAAFAWISRIVSRKPQHEATATAW